MNIRHSILEAINVAVSDDPPETGGILGSHDGELIDEFVMDNPIEIPEKLCSYCPNTNFLNHKIKIWQNRNISFMGIFHTHFAGVKTLSCGDRKYINSIMSVMPGDILHLYFPVFVLPDRSFICYKAKKCSGMIDIVQEELHLL